MPVTPFHVGPGLLLKAAAPRHLSLSAFIGANIAIDPESAYVLFTGGYPVHRILHTFLVARPSVSRSACIWTLHLVCIASAGLRLPVLAVRQRCALRMPAVR